MPAFFDVDFFNAYREQLLKRPRHGAYIPYLLGAWRRRIQFDIEQYRCSRFFRKQLTWYSKHGAIPETVDAAVSLLLHIVPIPWQQMIGHMTTRQFSRLHMSLGLWVRNSFNLWGKGNMALMNDAGTDHPDSVSTVILYGFWGSCKKMRIFVVD